MLSSSRNFKKYFCKFLVREIVFIQGEPHNFPVQDGFVFVLKPLNKMLCDVML